MASVSLAGEDAAAAHPHLETLATARVAALLFWRPGALEAVCLAKNEAMARLLSGARGMADDSSRSPVLGRRAHELSPELRPHWEEGIARALEGIGGRSEPIPFLVREESEARVEHHGVLWMPVRDAVGDVRGALGMLYDVTPVLERTRRLVGAIAHDLREPVVALRLAAKKLQGTSATSRSMPAARRSVPPRQSVRPKPLLDPHELVDLADRMSRLIGDAGSFAVLSGGEPVRLSPRPCDLGVVVRRVCDELREQVTAPLTTSVQSCYGTWDPDAVRRIVTNLVNNAREHGPPAGLVRVELTQSAGEATLDVYDQGKGIPAEEASRLFEPWHRGLSSNGQTSSGAGLGLYIVREIVAAHGGKIAGRRVDGGFLMRVTLPLAGSGVLARVGRDGGGKPPLDR